MTGFLLLTRVDGGEVLAPIAQLDLVNRPGGEARVTRVMTQAGNFVEVRETPSQILEAIRKQLAAAGAFDNHPRPGGGA